MANSGVIYEGGCVVSTLAGTGQPGYRDGAKDQAQFHFPINVAVDKDGDIYITDCQNHRLRKITMADGAVQTVAGTGKAGYKDGPAREAQFMYPDSIAIGHNGDVFFVEGSNRVRVFSPTSNTVRSIAVHEAGLSVVNGVAITAEGSVLVSDFANHRIVKIRAGRGSIETVAGDGKWGNKGGKARQAQFRYPYGIAVSSSGDIYVTDSGNHCLRKIDAWAGVVSTVAGTGAKGWRDGDASEAQFNKPQGLAIGSDGCVYICDRNNRCIRKFDPAHGRVSTVAGTGKGGVCDGDGDEARFDRPEGLTYGRGGVLYVADGAKHSIRAITLSKITKPEFSESDFQDIEKKLEEKTQLMSELVREIYEASACTLAAREDLEKTNDATIEANRALAETQNTLKINRLELRAIWEHRKAELETVENEVAKMESTKVERVTELASAKAKLGKAQTVLEKAIAEKTQHAEVLARVKVYLERARAKNAMEWSTGVVAGVAAVGLEDEKSKEMPDKRKTKTAQDGEFRVGESNVGGRKTSINEEWDNPMETMTGEEENEPCEVADGAAILKRNRAEEVDAQGETGMKKQRTPRPGVEEKDVTDAMRSLEKETDMQLDMAEKKCGAATLQDLDAVNATVQEAQRALERAMKEMTRLKKTMGLQEYAGTGYAAANELEANENH